jgi:hypothetical protein
VFVYPEVFLQTDKLVFIVDTLITWFGHLLLKNLGKKLGEIVWERKGQQN